MKRRDLSARIAGFRAWARVELGMPAAEFDLLTPAEFFRIVTCWEHRERRLRIADARLRYTIAASAGAGTPDGTPLTIKHFLNETVRRKKAVKKLTGQQLERAFIVALPKEWRPK